MPYNEKLPEWLNPGQEPPNTIKSSGWTPQDLPPAEWMNYHQHRTFKALDELQKNAIHQEIIGDISELPTEDKQIVSAITKIHSDTDMMSKQLILKATEMDSLIGMKSYDAQLGEIITTNGYYVSGDKGGGKYKIVSTGLVDDGYIVQLNNGLKAQLIHDGTIYARQYGVKLDGVTDDTNRLNSFFEMFGEAKLVVNDGIAITSKPLIVKGKWRGDSQNNNNNSFRKLIFNNATIRYLGPIDKCCIMFWHHYVSLIEGLAISRFSNKCYVDMTMVWHTEFKNFDIPMLCMNRETSIITEKIADRSIQTIKFSRGYIAGYNLKINSTGTWINSIHFYDVNFFSNKTTYCVEFYGTSSFQNITFNKCDLSYATKSIFYINQDVANSCSIKLDSCYLDSAIPYTLDNNWKGFKVTVKDSIEAAGGSNTIDVLYIKDYMKYYRMGVYGTNADSLPTMNMNLCKNGDLFCTNPLASPGWISNNANIIWSWKKGDSSLSGNILVATFRENVTTYLYSAIPAPFNGPYTAGLRLKLVSGTGQLQIGLGGIYRNMDLSKVLIGEEFVLTSAGQGSNIYTAGANLSPSLSLMNKGTGNVVIEISEIFIVPGLQARFMLPLHPKAQVFRCNNGTLNFSGDGMMTSKNIPHGLYATPSHYHVEKASLEAGNSGIKYVIADSTNLTVYFNNPPATGTGNMTLKWKAEI
ncbi:hypothetical protein [Priestia megaterium]|uniref:hypothetical protein n=1 Tax=Priestia megaterium TaxID=1404 RepID=UPI000BFD46BD|nr:hypothetical protein [Priestia megaterium]PGT76790.1 hypothetical protein COD15_02940 [Priestia megaterium]